MAFFLIQTNFINFSILLFMCVFIFTNSTLDRKKNRMFLLVLFSLFILLSVDVIDYYCASFSTPHLLRSITSGMGYTIRNQIILCFVYVVYPMTKRNLMLISIPYIINALFCLSSIWTKSVFYFDALNQFNRGPIGLIPFFTSGFYLSLLTILAIKQYKMRNLRESILILFISVMCIVATIAESVFKFNFFLGGIGSISTVFYYLFIHTETFKRDVLTGCYNRHTFFNDAERLKRVEMKVISIDLNNLKIINDIEGHAAGDKALITIVEAIQKRLTRDSTLYRIGGDEFMILSKVNTSIEAKRSMDNIVLDLYKTNYRIAYGIAEYKPSDDFDKICLISDKRMYENKINSKEKSV